MTHKSCVNDPEILCAIDQIYLNHNFDVNADKMMPTKESATIYDTTDLILSPHDSQGPIGPSKGPYF